MHTCYADPYLENHPCSSYILYMTVTKKGSTVARPRKSKIADSILHHKDVEVRLMASFLESAMRHAEKGDLVRAMACLRNAHDYEQAIPSQTKSDLYVEYALNA